MSVCKRKLLQGRKRFVLLFYQVYIQQGCLLQQQHCSSKAAAAQQQRSSSRSCCCGGTECIKRVRGRPTPTMSASDGRYYACLYVDRREKLFYFIIYYYFYLIFRYTSKNKRIQTIYTAAALLRCLRSSPQDLQRIVAAPSAATSMHLIVIKYLLLYQNNNIKQLINKLAILSLLHAATAAAATAAGVLAGLREWGWDRPSPRSAVHIVGCWS